MFRRPIGAFSQAMASETMIASAYSMRPYAGEESMMHEYKRGWKRILPQISD
jgi:hypothetical protein